MLRVERQQMDESRTRMESKRRTHQEDGRQTDGTKTPKDRQSQFAKHCSRLLHAEYKTENLSESTALKRHIVY